MRRNVTVIFWLIAIVLGALYAWDARHVMNQDGMNYLDMGDAYLRGDWSMAINAYWSPFYSWLLGLALRLFKPSLYWEFSVVHLVNFAVYVCALACFHFFLLEFLRYHRSQKTGASKDEGVTFPEWAWLVLGYTLFIWTSLKMITISRVTPDMCVAALVYLVCGILLRIRRGAASWVTFVFLGLVLGFGYLTKAAMFPLAFVFLAISLFSVGDLRKAIPRVLVALIAFVLVAGPYIVALSNAKDRLTFGDTGRLQYVRVVNGISSAHWQGGPARSGTPRHPTRKLFDRPETYEFGTPIKGTYPPGYDMSYWLEGVVLHFDLGKQLRALEANARVYYRIFFFQSSLIVGALILFFMGRRRWLWVKDIAEHWELLIPAVLALGMYLLIYVHPRYVAPFVALLWMGIFSGVRLPDSQESKRLLTSVLFAMLLPIMISIGLLTAPKAYSAARDLVKGEDVTAHIEYQVADGLKQMGVRPGDKVAYLGYSWGAYWARLARVRIVAEIPRDSVIDFWAADQSVRSQIIKAFAEAGAKAIVAKKVQNHVPSNGWKRIGNTDYYVYMLEK